jgi:hypothetical protein
LEVLNAEGERVGILNTFLYLSLRARQQLKNFLVAAGVVTEDTYKTFKKPANEIAALSVGRPVGIVTKENPPAYEGGEPTVDVRKYLAPDEALAAMQGTEVNHE